MTKAEGVDFKPRSYFKGKWIVLREATLDLDRSLVHMLSILEEIPLKVTQDGRNRNINKLVANVK